MGANVCIRERQGGRVSTRHAASDETGCRMALDQSNQQSNADSFIWTGSLQSSFTVSCHDSIGASDRQETGMLRQSQSQVTDSGNTKSQSHHS